MSLLEVRDLSIRFGGVQALRQVSFEMEGGKVHAVIGPNGAGKTTLFNLLTGIYRPTEGMITFAGQRIDGLAPPSLAALGFARTFQNLQVCMNMQALENVMVGAHRRLRHSIWQAALRLPSLRRSEAELRSEARDLMRFVGLDAYVEAPSGALPYGALKRLEIARALAAHPRVLFLDEPAGGLNATETADLTSLLRRIADQGVTVVLVEHDMKMVMRLCDHIVVLDYGRKLAEGSAAEVRTNPEVIAAYLGTHA